MSCYLSKYSSHTSLFSFGIHEFSEYMKLVKITKLQKDRSQQRSVVLYTTEIIIYVFFFFFAGG